MPSPYYPFFFPLASSALEKKKKNAWSQVITTSNNQLSENLGQWEGKDDVFMVLLKRMKSSYEHLFRFLFHQTSILKYQKRCLYLHFTAKRKYCFFSLVSHVCRVGRQVDTALLVHDIMSKVWEIQHSYSLAISTSVKIKHKLGCGNKHDDTTHVARN